MSYLQQVVTGDYETIGNIEDGDCVIAQAFGKRADSQGNLLEDPVNQALADKVVEFSCGMLPAIVQIEVALCMPSDVSPTVISTHRTAGKYLDTTEVLEQTALAMERQGLRRPIVVAHAFHIGRVAAQARLLGMNPIVPHDLPKNWDQASGQIWTKNRTNWAIHELLGYPVLKLQRKI